MARNHSRAGGEIRAAKLCEPIAASESSPPSPTGWEPLARKKALQHFQSCQLVARVSTQRPPDYEVIQRTCRPRCSVQRLANCEACFAVV
jgi:hypothetical protein